MSIWADQAVKELQERLKALEERNAVLERAVTALTSELRDVQSPRKR